MKVNDKAKQLLQNLLFEFRLGLDDIEDQQKIRYGIFNTPGPMSEEQIEKEEEKEDNLIRPSEISPVQLYTVKANTNKIPDNLIELKNDINHMLSNLDNNELDRKQIEKIYLTVKKEIEKG